MSFVKEAPSATEAKYLSYRPRKFQIINATKTLVLEKKNHDFFTLFWFTSFQYIQNSHTLE